MSTNPVTLTRIERETIINSNAEEKDAEVYTADPVMLRRMDKLCESRPDLFACVRECADGAKEYRCPKKCVRVSAPRRVSEEQRQAAAERFRRAREAKTS